MFPAGAQVSALRARLASLSDQLAELPALKAREAALLADVALRQHLQQAVAALEVATQARARWEVS